MIAAGLDIYEMLVINMKIELADLFLLFIYAEIVGMVGVFYTSNRIPVTLPIIIAITALCRLIVLNSKDADPLVLMAEAGAILVLSIAAYLMSLKDKLSLEKERKNVN
jgi:protein PsiE|tara:strand:+ start:174 stop:497 length:324 start_codon:yes stop_codon:yes gene_type:complete